MQKRENRNSLVAALLLLIPLLFGANAAFGAEPKTDQLLTAFIDAYNSSFPEGTPSPWMDLWADDAEWFLPSRQRPGAAILPGETRRGTQELAYWAKDTIGSDLRERKFVEKRRIIQGGLAAWEGIWAGLDHKTSLPIVMIIVFNVDGKVAQAHAYYDQMKLSNL